MDLQNISLFSFRGVLRFLQSYEGYHQNIGLPNVTNPSRLLIFAKLHVIKVMAPEDVQLWFLLEFETSETTLTLRSTWGAILHRIGI